MLRLKLDQTPREQKGTFVQESVLGVPPFLIEEVLTFSYPGMTLGLLDKFKV